MFVYTIPGQPVTWKRVGGSGMHRYDVQKSLKDQLQSIIITEMNKQSTGNTYPFARAVIFLANFWYKTPENRKHFEGEPCFCYGDCDNLVKLQMDICQNAGVFINDRQIYAMQVTKRYSKNPRTEIEVMEVKDGQSF
jgi:Holliday junction resolvase RusA-like endonuclease